MSSKNSEDKIYNYDEKKKLVYRIQNIKSKKQYFKLYQIVNKSSNTNLTKNSNGIFFNINKLNESTITEIEIFLLKIEKENEKELITDSEISYEDSENNISCDESFISSDNSSNLKVKKLIN